ncbi:hypothetical protein [Mesomycoplasma neurolyticum]|uniref:Uncharacterized protein n=1 Tax=Mesomycoplasma neurolyticum TaxID=2120 RepID=A0A449A6K2_9BACT|nr:hypothetical protein [Mesomycoplasma neurolyticum]VEU59852.1 Uncharacterised protein [Mesomycoplasma neurolyticum]
MKEVVETNKTYSKLKTYPEYDENNKIEGFTIEELKEYLNIVKKVKDTFNERGEKPEEPIDDVTIYIPEEAKYHEVIIDEKYLDNLICFNTDCTKKSFINFDVNEINEQLEKNLQELNIY